MIAFHRRITIELYKILNMVAVSVACAVAFFHTDLMREGSGFLYSLIMSRIMVVECALFFATLILWHLIFSSLDLYRWRRKLFSLDVVFDHIVAGVAGSLLITPTFYWILTRNIPAFDQWLISMSITIALSITIRAIPWIVLEWRRSHRHNLQHVVIVGINPRSMQYAENLINHPELGYQILGVFDDEPERKAEFGWIEPLPWLGKLDNLPEFFRTSVIDEAALFLPLRSEYDRASWVVRRCEEHGIDICFSSTIFEVNKQAPKISNVESPSHMFSFVHGYERTMGIAHTIKYSVDYVLALAGIILTSPLLLAVAIAVRLSSPGPIVFAQERIGLNRRRFKMYKFRTMVQDAEQQMQKLVHMNEMDGAAFKMQNDPRVTKLGKFLRKSSLDELPQLFNILKGEMSIVGPRPMSTRDYELFYDDSHRRRFSVRPGITCLWQVSGRSNIKFEEWMQLDLKYIDEWSLLKDFIILLKTVPAVISTKGAK